MRARIAVAHHGAQVSGVLPVEFGALGRGRVQHVLGEDAGLDALGQVDLLRRGEQRGLADSVQVDADQVGRGALRVQVLGGRLGATIGSGRGERLLEPLGAGTLVRDNDWLAGARLSAVGRRCGFDLHGHGRSSLRHPGRCAHGATAGVLASLNAVVR